MASRSRTRRLKRNNPAWPPKYYAGLSARKAATRRKEILKFGAKHWRDPAAYVGFATDKGVKGKSSGYTAAWKRKFGDKATSLKQKARATGVPLPLIKASYDRGMAAWRTGHRPGATQQQWGYARVHSMLLCGKTAKSTDADLVRKAKGTRKGKAWYASQGC